MMKSLYKKCEDTFMFGVTDVWNLHNKVIEVVRNTSVENFARIKKEQADKSSWSKYILTSQSPRSQVADYVVRNMTMEEFAHFKEEISDGTFLSRETCRILEELGSADKTLPYRIVDLMDRLRDERYNGYRGTKIRYVHHAVRGVQNYPIRFSKVSRSNGSRVNASMYMNVNIFMNIHADIPLNVHFPYDLLDDHDVKKFLSLDLDTIWDDALLRNTYPEFWEEFVTAETIKPSIDFVCEISDFMQWDNATFSDVARRLTFHIMRVLENTPAGYAWDSSMVEAIERVMPDNIYREASTEDLVVFNSIFSAVLLRRGWKYVKGSKHASIYRRCMLMNELSR